MLVLIMAIEDEKDHEKAAEIYKLYRGTMLYIAKSILHEPYLAEDAVSEAFIKILKNLGMIKKIDCYQTRGLIVIIVRNAAVDILRREKRKQAIPFEDHKQYSGFEEPVFDHVSAREACDRMVECIHGLNKNYSDILYLKIGMDYSYEEIGGILGISKDNAKMRLSRARKALKEQLGKGGGLIDRER